MKVSHFISIGLDEAVEFLSKHNTDSLESVQKVLSTASVSFLLEGISRVHSTLLCEQKFSYVQQSQRYVRMGIDSITDMPESLTPYSNEVRELIGNLYSFYTRASEQKENISKGRPKIEDYVKGIPIEDARYILPLATTTNITVTLSGDGLIRLWKLFKDYPFLWSHIKDSLTELVPSPLPTILSNLTEPTPPTDVSNDYFNILFKSYPDDAPNNVELFDAFGSADIRVASGALTSTSSNDPWDTVEGWGDDKVRKASATVERIMGYGHTGISEELRMSFLNSCSLSCYHQQIRHRIPMLLRESFNDLLRSERIPVVPPSFEQHKDIKEEYLNLVDETRKLRRELLDKGVPAEDLYGFLLNGESIRFFMNSNARADAFILSERTCQNAQWEIRELSRKKLFILRDEVSPTLFNKALPSCCLGACREGKMSCGKAKEVRRFFGISHEHD